MQTFYHDRKEIISGLKTGVGAKGRGGGAELQEDARKLWEWWVCSILIVLMASWLYTNGKTHQVLYFK